MFNKEVVVRCESGLHNRQATYFVQKANEFESSIWLESGSRQDERQKLAAGIVCSGCRDRYYRDPERFRS